MSNQIKIIQSDIEVISTTPEDIFWDTLHTIISTKQFTHIELARNPITCNLGIDYINVCVENISLKFSTFESNKICCELKYDFSTGENLAGPTSDFLVLPFEFFIHSPIKPEIVFCRVSSSLMVLMYKVRNTCNTDYRYYTVIGQKIYLYDSHLVREIHNFGGSFNLPERLWGDLRLFNIQDPFWDALYPMLIEPCDDILIYLSRLNRISGRTTYHPQNQYYRVSDFSVFGMLLSGTYGNQRYSKHKQNIICTIHNISDDTLDTVHVMSTLDGTIITVPAEKLHGGVWIVFEYNFKFYIGYVIKDLILYKDDTNSDCISCVSRFDKTVKAQYTIPSIVNIVCFFNLYEYCSPWSTRILKKGFEVIEQYIAAATFN